MQRRQHQDLDLRQRLSDFAGGGHPVFDRHVQIHEDHVGPEEFGEFDRFRAVAGLTHHLHVRLHGYQKRRPPPYERLVFRNHDSDGVQDGVWWRAK